MLRLRNTYCDSKYCKLYKKQYLQVCYKMASKHSYNTCPENPNTQADTNEKTKSIIMVWLSCKHEEKNKLVFVGIIVDVGIPTKGKSHPKDPKNKEEGNNREGENWVNLNESKNDNPSELIQIVKYLKEELKWVKEDNECILKAQE